MERHCPQSIRCAQFLILIILSLSYLSIDISISRLLAFLFLRSLCLYLALSLSALSLSFGLQDYSDTHRHTQNTHTRTHTAQRIHKHKHTYDGIDSGPISMTDNFLHDNNATNPRGSTSVLASNVSVTFILSNNVICDNSVPPCVAGQCFCKLPFSLSLSLFFFSLSLSQSPLMQSHTFAHSSTEVIYAFTHWTDNTPPRTSPAITTPFLLTALPSLCLPLTLIVFALIF